MSLFGSSGYRAIVDRSFMDVAFRFGFAMGNIFDSVLIAMDTRTSSAAIKHCVASGLLACGTKVYDAGTVPTPTLAYNARDFEAGVMITASHNPPEYNGIKPWNSDGSAFGIEQRRRIEELVKNDSVPPAPWQKMEVMRLQPDCIDNHVERILDDFPEPCDLKVVVDCGGGAGSVITPDLLVRMGCRVTAINSYPTGFFPRVIEPTAEALGDLSQTVISVKADLGLAHDADADRLVAVDELGRVVPGDKLMVLLARDMNVHSIVSTVDASMVIEDLGYSVFRTSVGDAHVSEQLKTGGDFGAEPAGAYIFPRVSYCPDGIYAAAMAVKSATRGRVSEQVDSIPSYPMQRGSVKSRGYLALEEIENSLAGLSPVSVSHSDGFRMTFEDGWLLVRPSGTEPKIRVTAEAKTPERARTLFQSVVEKLQELSQSSRRR